MIELIDSELRLPRKESEDRRKLMDQSKWIGYNLGQISKLFVKDQIVICRPFVPCCNYSMRLL